MHYNIKKLIEQYKINHTKNDLLVSDIIQMYKCADPKETRSSLDSFWTGMYTGWQAAFAAGYNKGMKDARKERTK